MRTRLATFDAISADHSSDGGGEARIVGRQEAEPPQQQRRGVEPVGIVVLTERLPPLGSDVVGAATSAPVGA